LFACPFSRAGYGSESEPDDEAATVSLVSDVDKLNKASRKSAIRLQEIGPRMTMHLVKVESGLCSGDVLFPMSGKFHVLSSWFSETASAYTSLLLNFNVLYYHTVGKEDAKKEEEEEEIEDAEDLMELEDGSDDDSGDEE
jgi:ribosome biogenesis protein SSF1/2